MVIDRAFRWGRSVAIGFLPFGAPVMAMNPRPTANFCSVVDGAKLPAASGRGAALCKAIIAAAGPRLARSRARVVVRVESPTMLVANLRTARGRSLPEITYVVSDKRLDQASFDRFAHEIARQLANRG